jgi:hypothetical protein
MLNSKIYSNPNPFEHKYKRHCVICGKGLKSHSFSTRKNKFKLMGVELPFFCHGHQQKLLTSKERMWL